jgi:hypothetical protein
MKLRFALKVLMCVRCMTIATLLPFLAVGVADLDDYTWDDPNRIRLVTSGDE